jgi:hypothetical protein
MAELYPDGTAGVRSPSVLATVLALTAALMLGAGAAVAVYALVDDEAVTTVVKTVEAPQVRTDTTAPTGSLAGTTTKSARTDAAHHAATIQRLGARDSTAGTPADGDAAVAAGTAVKDEAAVAAAIAQEQHDSSYGVSAGTAAKDEAKTAAAIGNP